MSSYFNPPFLIAAALFAGAAALHAFMGGPEINRPIQLADLEPTVRSTSAVVWHFVTALALVMSGALVWLSRNPNRPVTVVVMAVNACFVLTFWTVGWAAFGSLWTMPQWSIFMTIAVVMAWGMRREKAKTW